jgi:signal transduction histidine kinase
MERTNRPSQSTPTNLDTPPSPDDRTLDERLAYLNLGPEDAERLRTLRPHFDRQAASMVEEFYDHLFSFPTAAKFLGDDQLVARLKRLQHEHFRSLFDAQWNESYAQRRRQVGQAHADVGIDPELFLGAYNQYMRSCFLRFIGTDKPATPEMIDALMSLMKVVFLDLGLTLDSYFAQSTQTMRHVLDMYWKANIELRQFAALASHDLKTPLATVANLCDEALDEFGDQMPPGARELISAAKQRSFRMGTMLDELLATTVSLNEQDSLGPIETEDSLAEAIDRVKPTLEKKQIKLELPEQMPRVWGNRVRLRESFYNLLSNAAKFIERKPGRIAIELIDHGNEYEFTIADNGPGIPREELERIFAPFRRLAMHRDHPGSGLGLYFTKTMIEHQQGRIWVDSHVGQGSTFHIVLLKPGIPEIGTIET